MDHADFDQLCREHYAHVVRGAYLVTGDLQEARDLTQEAFARAFARWPSVRKLDAPEAWVHRVAINLAISWWRRRRVRQARPLSEAGVLAPPEPVDDELVDALNRLSPAQRATVVLRFYSDMSIDDVARALGKRPGTVRALTAQGIARLRSILGDRYEEVHDEDAR
jgi:RNA polymerase sigma-70 factor (ECF subfamily)